MKTIKDTLTVTPEGRVITQKYNSVERKIFQKIFDGDLEESYIRISYQKRVGCFLEVEFITCNNKSIKENLHNYNLENINNYNNVEDDENNSVVSLLTNPELKMDLSKLLDDALTEEDYVLYKTNPADENFYAY